MEDGSDCRSRARMSFGPFCLSPTERLLTRDGAPVEIGGRSLDLLAALVEEHGRVVSKRELLKRVWPDVVVEDGSLRFHMAGLRKILGDGDEAARYIATQVGVGYAFVAPVRQLRDPDEFVAFDRTEDTPVGRLPARLSRLYGRETDVELLVDRVADVRLFTIVGPAGVGKTTVAVEIAHALQPRFAEKVHFVDLSALEDPAHVPSSLAAALGIPVQGDDPMAVILGHIRHQEMLLVLDNCEHLIDAVATIIERIAGATQKVAILATSREPLRVRGEHVHWLGSLDYPDEPAALSFEELLAFPAVALFVERATAGNSALCIDLDAARQIAEMCCRLDGMALPIELTAVRVGTHGLKATASLLGERFSLTWSGRRTALPRQQTLQSTLDWSYQLLSDHQRLTLERLSVFLGPFSVTAALEVVADEEIGPDAVAAALDELTNKSLISPDRWGEPGFYRLPEITRAYARERRARRGREEINATARRHAILFLKELEGVWASDGTYLGRAPRFSLHLSSVRNALNWAFGAEGDLTIGVPLAAASAPVFLTLSLVAECRTWCARALAHLEDVHRDSSPEMELQAALGLSLMFTRGNSEAAETALRRALSLAGAQGDRWNQLRILGRLHIFHERIGDFKAARTWADMAVQVANAISEPEAVAVAASLAGISYHLAGEHSCARRELDLSLQNSSRSNRPRTIYYGFDHRNRSSITLARTLWLQGCADQAKQLAARTVREAASLDYPATHCIALASALSVDICTGDLDQADIDLESFTLCAEMNAFGPYIAAAGGFRGKLYVERGHLGQSLGLIEESLARMRSARYELLATSFCISLTKGLVMADRHEEALDLVNENIDRCNGNGELFAMPELLRIKAGVAHALVGKTEAETLLLDSLAMSRRQGARSWELRSAIDLARLWIADKRSADALALLGPLRETFREGFDTTDLRAADLLLGSVADGERLAAKTVVVSPPGANRNKLRDA